MQGALPPGPPAGTCEASGRVRGVLWVVGCSVGCKIKKTPNCFGVFRGTGQS